MKDLSDVKLNLGCGSEKRPGFINIDIDDNFNPDITTDIETGLPFGSNSVDAVIALDFLEYISIGKTIFVINEIWRVLKPGGTFEHITPSTDGRGAFQDPTHKSFWNINSWFYFCDGQWSGQYGIESNFKIIKLSDVVSNEALKIVHTHGFFSKGEEQTK